MSQTFLLFTNFLHDVNVVALGARLTSQSLVALSVKTVFWRGNFQRFFLFLVLVFHLSNRESYPLAAHVSFLPAKDIPFRPELFLMNALHPGAVSVGFVVTVDDLLEAALLLALSVWCLSHQDFLVKFLTNMWQNVISCGSWHVT